MHSTNRILGLGKYKSLNGNISNDNVLDPIIKSGRQGSVKWLSLSFESEEGGGVFLLMSS